MTFPVNALPVNVLMDGWEKGDLAEHSICGVHQQRDLTCAACQARIPFARGTCKTCKGNGKVIVPPMGKRFEFGACPTCDHVGTVPLDLVLASGKCHCKNGYVDTPKTYSSKPCPTCHATGLALIDPFPSMACSDARNAPGWLTTLYAAIAGLRDTCRFHMVLGDEASVERMRAWTHPTDEHSGHALGCPLDNIVYYNAQLEEVIA